MMAVSVSGADLVSENDRLGVMAVCGPPMERYETPISAQKVKSRSLILVFLEHVADYRQAALFPRLCTWVFSGI